MISFESKDLKTLEKALQDFESKAFPFAVRQTLKESADVARDNAKRTVRNKMVNRNKWTVGGIRSSVYGPLKVDRMYSEIGSKSNYMETQEFGGVERSRGKHGVPIPTSFSAGQGRSKTRTRVPMSKNRLRRIQMARRPRRPGNNTKQNLIVAIRVALKGGSRYFYGDGSMGFHRKGIYDIGINRLGAGRDRGWPDDATLEMVHNLDKRIVGIPKTPWLKPSVDQVVGRQITMIYRRNLIRQIKREQTFRRLGVNL